jgi:protein SCO1/2
LFESPGYREIYAHGSFVHLADAEGELLTLLPPVLDVGQMVSVARGYPDPQS